MVYFSPKLEIYIPFKHKGVILGLETINIKSREKEDGECINLYDSNIFGYKEGFVNKNQNLG